MNTAGAQRCEGFVGLFERESFRRGADRDAGREVKEFVAVLAGEVGDGSERSFVPEKAIREWRDIAHMNSAANQDAAFGESAKRDGHERTG